MTQDLKRYFQEAAGKLAGRSSADQKTIVDGFDHHTACELYHFVSLLRWTPGRERALELLAARMDRLAGVSL